MAITKATFRRPIKTDTLDINEVDESKIVFYDEPHFQIKGVSSEDGGIHLNIGINRFQRKSTPIPNDAVIRDPPHISWIREYFIDKNKTRIIPNLEFFSHPPRGKSYRIEDNGGMPFVVYVDECNSGLEVGLQEEDTCKTAKTEVIHNANVGIYAQPLNGYMESDDWECSNNEQALEYHRLFYQMRVMYLENVEVFVGKDTVEGWDGNSILIRLRIDTLGSTDSSISGNTGTGHDNGTGHGSTPPGRDRYVYIGSEIQSFTLRHSQRIVEYYSAVGNNAVPYPLAVGPEVVVFMIEGKLASREEVDLIIKYSDDIKINDDSVYDCIWGAALNSTDLRNSKEADFIVHHKGLNN